MSREIPKYFPFSENTRIPTMCKTLYDLGYEVKISHERLAYNNDEKKPETYFARKFDIPTKHEILSNGGRTLVTLIDMETLDEFDGEAECSIHDNFCRQTGVLFAIRRASKNARLNNVARFGDTEDEDWTEHSVPQDFLDV